MKGAPADKNVRNASQLKRADIGSRDVSAKIAESAEENRDVTRPNGDRGAVLFDCPATLFDQPSNESSGGLRKGFIDAPIDDLTEVPVWLRNRQRDQGRPSDDLGPRGLKRDISCLAAVHTRRHLRGESQIDERLDRGRSAE